MNLDMTFHKHAENSIVVTLSLHRMHREVFP